MMRQPDVRRGIPLALCAGTLLGAGAPLSKLLVARMDPVALAGALYTGPAIIAALALLLGFGNRRRYVPVTRRDVPRLAVAVVTGTIAAPVLLMYGIRISSGFAASLMLNMEAVATALIALAFFGERVSSSIWLAVLCMTVMGVLVTGTGGAGSTSLAGAMLILGSCIAWGIETNFVTTLSSRNPLVVTLMECLPAAITLSLVAALRAGGLPPVRDLLLGVLLGSFSNGVGLLLYFASLRTMGAARTAAFAGVGPLAGALLSLVLFRTAVTWIVVAALGLTGAAILAVGRDDERRSLVQETVGR
ncbi:MAG: DMT family transporter [Candidatus Cryosericum sp.]